MITLRSPSEWPKLMFTPCNNAGFRLLGDNICVGFVVVLYIYNNFRSQFEKKHPAATAEVSSFAAVLNCNAAAAARAVDLPSYSCSVFR